MALMSESNSRNHGRGREGSAEGNRGHYGSGGRKFEKHGGAAGRREERRGDFRDDRRGGRAGAKPRRNDRNGHGGKNKVSHPQRSGYARHVLPRTVPAGYQSSVR